MFGQFCLPAYYNYRAVLEYIGLWNSLKHNTLQHVKVAQCKWLSPFSNAHLVLITEHLVLDTVRLELCNNLQDSILVTSRQGLV